MSRDYRIIKGGKFSGESFNVNAAGALYLGLILRELGLPVSTLIDIPSAPHCINEQTAKVISFIIGEPGFRQQLTDIISSIPRREELSGGTIEEDVQWVTEFLSMARNEEGFASDYCEEYH